MKKQRYYFPVKFPPRGGYLDSTTGFTMSDFISRNKEKHIFIHKPSFATFLDEWEHAWGSYVHYPPHGMSDKSVVELLIDRTRDYPFNHNHDFNQTNLQNYHDGIIHRLGSFAEKNIPVST